MKKYEKNYEKKRKNFDIDIFVKKYLDQDI